MTTNLNVLLEQYKRFKDMNLHIDLSRGKPSKEQLDLSMSILDVVNSKSSLINEDGVDCRNYGVLDGISECKQLFADLLEIKPENIIVYGNSSLNLMFDCISYSMTHGVLGSTPWMKLNKPIKWLCPVPGYDRHFAITEFFGIEMINIPMFSDGPDMDLIEELIKDDCVKGIWCVPKYSNPTGITYSDEAVRRFARLKPAAKDFRIYWDNAYVAHHLYDDNQDTLLEILNECKKAGNPNLVYEFTSTSKISFPGSGVAAFASSEENVEAIKTKMRIQTIGFDKINQLRHAKYLENIETIKLEMRNRASVLRPKFELVENILEKELNGLAEWNKPRGGYFITLKVNGHAKEIIDRCKQCGVILTDAGCTFPYHRDLTNSFVRIAPSFLESKELELATQVLCVCSKIEILGIR